MLCALVAVGLAIWAFSAQSDADDAEAKLSAQQQESAPASPPAEADAETQKSYEEAQANLSAWNAPRARRGVLKWRARRGRRGARAAGRPVRVGDVLVRPGRRPTALSAGEAGAASAGDGAPR